jgi:hypothetical protein
MKNKHSLLVVVVGIAMIATMTSIISASDSFAAKKYDKSQLTIQTNSCGNGEILVENKPHGVTEGLTAMGDGGSDIPEITGGTFCQNIDSQIQGKENSAALSGVQQ